MNAFTSTVAKVRASRGFTLLELLVVIGIISLLLVLATPAILSLIGGNRLTAAGEQITAFLSDAQQSASAYGTSYEVRFMEENIDGLGPMFRSVVLCRNYQIGEPNPDPDPSQTGKPLEEPISVIAGEVLVLPDEVIISQSASASPLIADLMVSSDAGTAPIKQIRGKRLIDFELASGAATGRSASFIIRPEGTDLLQGNKWFVTLGDIAEFTRDGDSPESWKNFFCIQVDPLNGRLTTYRP